MKIIKMPDKATEQFDRFVQQQLNQVDIDLSRSGNWANNMQFPVAVEPAEKRGWMNRFFGGNRKYFSLLLLLIFSAGITAIMINTSNTKREQGNGSKTKPQNAAGNIVNTIPEKEKNQVPENTVQAESSTNIVSINQENNTKKNTAEEPGGNTAKNKTAAVSANKAITEPVKSNDGVALPINNAQPQTVTTAPLPDSAVNRSAEKKTPVKKDTIHVIW